MSHDPFKGLPDDARLWVFALDRPLKGADRAKFEDDIRTFLESWRHKGKTFDAVWELRYQQLLLVAEPFLATAPSGCAIDGMLRKVERIVSEAGAKLASDQVVVILTEKGLELHCRSELPCLLRSGTIRPDTTLIDRSLHDLSQLRQGRLERPLLNTWIGHKYGLVLLHP